MTTLLFQMEDYLPVPSADLSVATDVSESSSRYGDNHQLTQFKVEFKMSFWLSQVVITWLRFFQHFDGETGTKPNNYNKMSRSMRGRFMRSTPLNQTVDSRWGKKEKSSALFQSRKIVEDLYDHWREWDGWIYARFLVEFLGPTWLIVLQTREREWFCWSRSFVFRTQWVLWWERGCRGLIFIPLPLAVIHLRTRFGH